MNLPLNVSIRLHSASFTVSMCFSDKKKKDILNYITYQKPLFTYVKRLYKPHKHQITSLTRPTALAVRARTL